MDAFVASSKLCIGQQKQVKLCRSSSIRMSVRDEQSSERLMSELTRLHTGLATMAIMGTPFGALAGEAAADESVLKTLFKTKVLALAHPLAMWGAVGYAGYVFYLGSQARTLRTTADQEVKKDLAKKKPGQKHFVLSAWLLAATTFFTFEGMANTYTRTGKLFPGPHLYAGLGIVSILAFMTALVPAMQKNQLWARNTHFTLAVGALGLFGWQAKTGMDIVGKLLGFK
eukprot:CAMPEP_0184742276 /NCGR_PEP_ID=MMETSP0315-20130426/5251_1 /TAXON_ID=101924 /ORGANISM="Rhodosorus marinus, Strain UTEX LB 2760" /LENGTH=227 /DNA_ID=CAMNT_0027213027 /DNA_START=84 /DNA_END=767 /DNA_ORIENTATION=+